MRCWIDCLACLALVASPLAPEREDEAQESAESEAPRAPKDASELLGELARIEGLEAAFDEVKHLDMLAKPLRRSGRLYYLRGGWVTQVVEEPSPAIVTITPDELRIAKGGDVDVRDLKSHAEARLFVRSIALVWTGDEPALAQAFAIDFTVDDDDDERSWSLELTPRSERLGRLLTGLTVAGRDFAVRRIEIEAPGERTVLEIRDADPKRRFTDEEKLRWFGIEPDR